MSVVGHHIDGTLSSMQDSRKGLTLSAGFFMKFFKWEGSFNG